VLVSARSTASDVQTVQIAGDSAVRTLLGLVPGVFAQFLYAVLLSIFILSEKQKYRQKLIAMHKSLQMRLRFARMIRDIGKKVSGYFFVITVLNIFDGAATAAAFYFLGLPDPILWGVAFGVANFVPVIGAMSVILASALIGIAVQDNLIMALAGPAAMTAINAVESNIIQPLLLSRRMVVNPVALLVSFAFFTWTWGAAATVLSVPMVVCFSVIAKYTPGMRPLAVLLTNEKPVRGGLARFLSTDRKLRINGTFAGPSRL
jgi:predicted PurR-regulated permease PerM